MTKSIYSKSYKEGIETLFQESEMAHQWGKPLILFAIFYSNQELVNAQAHLEKKLLLAGIEITRIQPTELTPDVIKKTLINNKSLNFISGFNLPNNLTNGKIYQALNLNREYLIENNIRSIFWLSDIEAQNISKTAPDFWAFRHRVIEFSPKKGLRNPEIPLMLFRWNEDITQSSLNILEKKKRETKNLLQNHLRKGNLTTQNHLDATLKLLQINWEIGNINDFETHLDIFQNLVEKYPSNFYQGWLKNIIGIKHFQSGERNRAITSIKSAVHQDPDNLSFQINSAIAHHGIGKNRDANAILEKILVRQNNSEYLKTIGYIYLLMGKFDKSFNILFNALKINPDSYDLMIALDICTYKIGQIRRPNTFTHFTENAKQLQNYIYKACNGYLMGAPKNGLSIINKALNEKKLNLYQVTKSPEIFFLYGTKEQIALKHGDLWQQA